MRRLDGLAALGVPQGTIGRRLHTKRRSPRIEPVGLDCDADLLEFDPNAGLAQFPDA